MAWSRRTFLRKTGLVSGGVAVGGLSSLLDGCAMAQNYDVVIRGGTMIDGTGGPPVIADVAIVGDRIVKTGTVGGTGARTIDASGKIVCPGFIDIHSHTDLSLLVEPRAESKIRQGVTTEVAGQDGSSLAPLNEAQRKSLQEGYGRRYGVDIEWTDFTGLFDTLDRQGIGLNFMSMAGQGTIRGHVAGNENVAVGARQLDAMKALVEQAMSEGACGLSSGLEYTPGSFADEDEIAELAKMAAGYNGFYATHMRNEDDYLLEAVGEAIRTAGKAEIPLHIAHFKASGRRNLEKVALAFDMIEQAVGEGMDITLDRYPYIAYATTLQNLFPTRFRSGGTEAFVQRLQAPDTLPLMKRAAVEKVDMLGDWSAVMITRVARAENQDYVGRRVSEIVLDSGQDPFEFVRELLIAENGSVGMVGFGMSEEEVRSVLVHPLVMVASDGGAAADYGPLSETAPHPRYYGTFPRVLGRYARDGRLFDLPVAVHKMTGMPARRLGLSDRGTIDVGLVADLVVFDPETVIDRADFTNPHQYAAGIDYVMVNGSMVIEKGEHTGALAGKVLRNQPGAA